MNTTKTAPTSTVLRTLAVLADVFGCELHTNLGLYKGAVEITFNTEGLGNDDPRVFFGALRISRTSGRVLHTYASFRDGAWGGRLVEHYGKGAEGMWLIVATARGELQYG